MGHGYDGRFGPGDDRHGAALYGLIHEVLAVEDRTLERAEHTAGNHFPMVDGETRHFRIAVDARELAKAHSF
jgi:hypothetical protein